MAASSPRDFSWASSRRACFLVSPLSVWMGSWLRDLVGSFYLIGMWYKRKEAQKRYTFFFASTTLAGAFGGLLASAIGKMDGVPGYLGWRWVFILEGILTCLVSFVIFFAIPDFPEDVKWLSETERAYVRARLQEDQGKSALERPITFKDVVNCFKDYKIFLGGLMYFGLIVPGKERPTLTRGWDVERN